jgi:hypothetical protein
MLLPAAPSFLDVSMLDSLVIGQSRLPKPNVTPSAIIMIVQQTVEDSNVFVTQSRYITVCYGGLLPMSQCFGQKRTLYGIGVICVLVKGLDSESPTNDCSSVSEQHGTAVYNWTQEEEA